MNCSIFNLHVRCHETRKWVLTNDERRLRKALLGFVLEFYRLDYKKVLCYTSPEVSQVPDNFVMRKSHFTRYWNPAARLILWPLLKTEQERGSDILRLANSLSSLYLKGSD